MASLGIGSSVLGVDLEKRELIVASTKSGIWAVGTVGTIAPEAPFTPAWTPFGPALESEAPAPAEPSFCSR